MAVADYRLYPQVRYPAFLADGALAVRWLRAELARREAPDARLFLMGHSAGAYNAAMLALDPQRNTAGLARRLREVGVPVVERFYDQANHMTLIGALSGPLRWVGPVLDDVALFVGAEPG